MKKNLLITTVVCVAILALSNPGHTQTTGKKVKWDYFLFTGINHPITVYLKGFADEVKKRTNDQLEIVVRPSGELPYKATEVVKIVSDNSVQLGQGYMGFISGEAPLAGLGGMPFLLRNTKDVEKVWPILKQYTEKDFNRYGVTTLFYFCWPSQNIFGRGKVIRTAEDFTGRKIRAADPKQSEMLRLLKSTSVTLTTAEVPIALDRGIVEGVMSSAFNITGAKWAESFHWAWLPDINPGGPDFQIINKKALEQLSPQTRDILKQAAEQWTVKMNVEITAQEVKSRQELKENNKIELIYPDQTEVNKIEGIMKGYWEKWAKDNGPEAVELVDKIRKALGK